MPEVWLVCEGESDVAVLSGVLTTVLAADILVRPGGGSSSAASVADYLARSHKVHVAYVMDRDYRRREICERAFTDGSRGFFWRRHAIESYLLEPAVIVHAVRSLKASLASLPGGGPAEIRSLPEDAATIAEGLRSCASSCAPREAGHIALHRLWEDLSETAGRVQKRTPPVLGGSAVPEAEACRRGLLDEAARLVERAGEASKSPHLTPVAVSARYDDQLARVAAASYLADLRFLEEFNGRALLGAFLAWLQREHRVSLRRRTLLRELEKAVPVVYGANRSLYGADDFLDLANGVRALAGMPPIR